MTTRTDININIEIDGTMAFRGNLAEAQELYDALGEVVNTNARDTCDGAEEESTAKRKYRYLQDLYGWRRNRFERKPWDVEPSDYRE